VGKIRRFAIFAFWALVSYFLPEGTHIERGKKGDFNIQFENTREFSIT